MWKCGSCNFIWLGDKAPEVCPRCGAKNSYSEVPADKAKLAERSALTNCLHQELTAILEKARKIAQKGVDDNLDPGCLKIFKESVAFAEEMKRKILAEIEVHVGKGKWGV